MKPRKSRRNASDRVAAARWLGVIICLCIGLGAGFTLLMSLAQNWGAVPTLGYLALCLAAFIVAAFLGKRAATTHL